MVEHNTFPMKCPLRIFSLLLLHELFKHLRKYMYYGYGHFACICLSIIDMQYLQRPREGVRSPGKAVADSYKPLFGYRESNQGLLGEQPVFLITELSLKSGWSFKDNFFRFSTFLVELSQILPTNAIFLLNQIVTFGCKLLKIHF